MKASDPGPFWRRDLRFWGPEPDADVDDELGHHLEWRVEELTGRGPRVRRAGCRDVPRVDARTGVRAYRVAPLTELIDRAIASQRMLRGLLLGTALIALTLATAGIYGVTSYYVAQRTQELGVRIALGAQPVGVRMLVVRQTAALAGTGLAIGLLGAAAAARALSRLLYGGDAGEVTVNVIATFVLAGTTLLACVGPLRRATAVDPVKVLRGE